MNNTSSYTNISKDEYISQALESFDLSQLESAQTELKSLNADASAVEIALRLIGSGIAYKRTFEMTQTGLPGF